MLKDYAADNTQSQETPMSLSICPLICFHWCELDSLDSSLDDGLTASVSAVFPKSQFLRP